MQQQPSSQGTAGQTDYSWEGLAAILWPGWLLSPDGNAVPGQGTKAAAHRPATLQDYWRSEEQSGLLVAGRDGRLWTRHHIPCQEIPADLLRHKTWLDEAAAALVARLSEARASEFDHGARPLKADGRAQFGGVHFRRALGASWPKEEALRINARDAVFCCDEDFSEQRFDSGACFGGARFLGGLEAKRADFAGATDFEGAAFERAAGFERTEFAGTACFRGARWVGAATFLRSVFADDADFRGCAFGGEAVFEYARFQSSAFFNGSSFRGPCSFENAMFIGQARLRETLYSDRINFRTAVFERWADFSGVHFPPNLGHTTEAFRGTLFKSTADFSRVRLVALPAFAGTFFERQLLFDDDAFEMERAFRRAYRDCCAEARKLRSDRIRQRAERERLFADLEGGCRTLRIAMEARRDRSRELRLNRYELIARRRRPSVTRAEWTFSWLYGASSNYGESIVRPVGVLLASTFLFALVYLLLRGELASAGSGVAVGPLWLPQAALEAWSFSLSNVFSPFGVWSPELLQGLAADGGRSWAVALLEDSSPATRLAVRLIGTLQSALSIALLFLFGLALRRRFRVT